MALLVLIILPGRAKGVKNTRIMRVHFIPIAVAAIAGNCSGPAAALAWTDISLAALIAGSIAAALVRDATPSISSEEAFLIARKFFLVMVAFTCLIIVCLLAGLLVGGVPSAVRLGYTGHIPSFLYHILLLRPYEGLCMLRAYGFYRYSEGWIPGVFLTMVMALEFIGPGTVTQLITKGARLLVKSFQIEGPIKLQTSPAGAVGAVVALAALVYMLYKRYKEGWLSGEAIRKMMSISLKFMILPLVIFIIAVNMHRVIKDKNVSG